MTFMERMSGRLAAIESVLKKLEPVESLLERITLLENTIFTTKRVFTFQEACMYIGVSESMLYKLTSSKEIPHYKPRGKMVYFAKEELDEWLLQNYEPTMNEAVRSVAAEYFDGREVTEGLLNHIEVAIRAYDPCLSCATHAVGKMPLRIEVVDADGQLADVLLKHEDGTLERPTEHADQTGQVNRVPSNWPPLGA